MARISTARRQISVEKQFVDYEVGSPDSSPLHVNHFQVSRGEGDWYLDVGTVPIDDMLNREAKSVRFLVTQRLAMSLQSIKKLRDQIAEVLEKAEGSTNESVETTKQEPKTARKRAIQKRRASG